MTDVLIAGPAALLVGASFYFFARATRGFLKKKWKTAALHICGALLSFVASGVYMGVALVLWGLTGVEGAEFDPSQKARVLAETIACTMNLGVITAPLGLLLGLMFPKGTTSEPGR